MNIVKHIFIVSILTISYNAFGMFGFGLQLRHYPHELKAIYQEEATRRNNKETSEQTFHRHTLEWIQEIDRQKIYNAQLKREEKESMAKIAKALAQKPHTHQPVNIKTAQGVVASNREYEERTKRRSSLEQPKHTNKQFIQITLNASCPTGK